MYVCMHILVNYLSRTVNMTPLKTNISHLSLQNILNLIPLYDDKENYSTLSPKKKTYNI